MLCHALSLNPLWNLQWCLGRTTSYLDYVLLLLRPWTRKARIQMILMMKTSLSNNELQLDIKKTTRSSEDFGDKNCAERISVRLGFKKLEKVKEWNINVRVNVTSVLEAGKYIFNFINEKTRLMLWILSLQKQPLEVFYKNVLLKISQNLQKNTCFRVHYSIKLQVSVLQFSLKKDPSTGVFLRVSRNF